METLIDFSTIVFGFSIYAWITMLTIISIFAFGGNVRFR